MALTGEKALEARLLDKIKGGLPVEILNSTSDAKTLADLFGNHLPKWLQDTSDFNPAPKFMQDIIGGMTPDIVLRSPLSGENRLYIEVKEREPLGYGIADSQIVRYFLHLLAISTRLPVTGQTDIRRAVLVCAPSEWFKVKTNADVWGYFLQHFSGLAKTFDITLGELHADTR